MKSMSPKELNKNFPDFTILAVGVSVILLGFAMSWPRTHWQQLCILILGLYYTLWGVWHHSRHKTLTAITLFEYIGISGFVCAILWFALSY